MKNTLVILVLVLSYHCSWAQPNKLRSDGNVGIGTENPEVALKIVRGGTNAGADYPSVNIATSGSGSIFGPILYLNGMSGTGGRMWGMVSSGALDATATGAAGNFAIYDTNGGSRLVINSSGNIGIGTLNPTTGLLVAQGKITSQTVETLAAGDNDAFNLFAGGNGYLDGARQSILWSQAGLTLGRFGTEYNLARTQLDFVWRDLYNSRASTAEVMRLTGGGNLGIGTANPDAKLAVNGTIHARAVKVDLNGWADYVFRSEYHLPTLQEVKIYIDKHQHLPDMPSEYDVASNGINLGEINKLLTKKVEELTLYLIEKDQQRLEQLQINQEQQKKYEKQEARIIALERALLRLSN